MKIYIKRIEEQKNNTADDPLVPEIKAYLSKFDFPLAYFIQKKFKIGCTRAERILRQIEGNKNADMHI